MKKTNDFEKKKSLVRSKKEFFLLPNDKLTAILRDERDELLSLHGFSKVFARVTVEVFDGQFFLESIIKEAK